jgi:hypothetical protein
VYSYRQIFLYDASTSRTPLSGVPGIYFYQLPTSTLSLIRKHEYELRPGCIMDAAMHTIIMAFLFHPVATASQLPRTHRPGDHPEGWGLPGSSFAILQVKYNSTSRRGVLHPFSCFFFYLSPSNSFYSILAIRKIMGMRPGRRPCSTASPHEKLLGHTGFSCFWHDPRLRIMGSLCLGQSISAHHIGAKTQNLRLQFGVLQGISTIGPTNPMHVIAND